MTSKKDTKETNDDVSRLFKVFDGMQMADVWGIWLMPERYVGLYGAPKDTIEHAAESWMSIFATKKGCTSGDMRETLARMGVKAVAT